MTPGDVSPWGEPWVHAGTGVAIHERPGTSRVPLVLLHCIGLDSGMWTQVLPYLPGDLPILGVDLPGHGASRAPAEPAVTLSRLAETIASALRARGIAPSLVAGISMGGMVAQHLGLSHGDLVAGLLLSNTGHDQTTDRRAMMLDRAAQVRSHGMEATSPSTVDRWFTPRFRESHPDRIARLTEQLRRVDPEVHARSWEAIAGLNLATAIRRIAVPTVVLAGEFDASTPPGRAQDMTALMPAATYHELPGVGHISALEDPDGWAAVATGLLHRIEDTAPT